MSRDTKTKKETGVFDKLFCQYYDSDLKLTLFFLLNFRKYSLHTYYKVFQYMLP